MALRFITLAALLAATLCATFTVTTNGLTFSPSTVTVSVGDTVTWTGLDIHTVTQVDSSSSTTRTTNGFRSGNVGAVTNFSKTFDAATVGTATTFFYICEPHASSGMRGQVNVVTATPRPSCASLAANSFFALIVALLAILV
jgi:plastocyanin